MAGSSQKKEKPVKKSSSKSSTLEEVSSEIMAGILDDNDEVLQNCPFHKKYYKLILFNHFMQKKVLVLFYEDDKSPKTKKIVTTLEKLEFKEYPDLPFIRCSDTAEASAFGVKPEELPQIVLFFNGIPDEYEGIMRN